MRRDGVEVLLIGVVFIAVAIFVVGAVAAIAERGIADDCKDFGMFRYGETVYECRVRE